MLELTLDRYLYALLLQSRHQLSGSLVQLIIAPYLDSHRCCCNIHHIEMVFKKACFIQRTALRVWFWNRDFSKWDEPFQILDAKFLTRVSFIASLHSCPFWKITAARFEILETLSDSFQIQDRDFSRKLHSLQGSILVHKNQRQASLR